MSVTSCTVSVHSHLSHSLHEQYMYVCTCTIHVHVCLCACTCTIHVCVCTCTYLHGYKILLASYNYHCNRMNL